MFNVYTPSYNKAYYVLEAIKSVRNQTCGDFKYWIAENSNDERTKSMVHDYVTKLGDKRIVLLDEEHDQGPKYYPSVYLNKYMEKMNDDDFVVWLSDDDLLKPNCLERIKQEVSAGDKDIVYWSLVTSYMENCEWVDRHTRIADKVISRGTNIDCMLDGGQISHKVSCIRELEKPYWREVWDNDTAHCDGTFFNRLIVRYPFYPINEVLSTKRTFNQSVFTKK